MFVTMNSKMQVAYEKVFKEIKEIITVNATLPILLQTYTIDYELALENALKLVFPSQKRIGCFFHYIQCMVLWLKKNGFGKKEYTKDSQEIIYLLSIIVFKYRSDMEYVYTTIDNLKKKYPAFLGFFAYYEANWYKYLKDTSLDYTKITKLQRSNSYIENYNKIIKSILGKNSKLSWPKFITFIKEQENIYYKKIIDREKTTVYNGAKIYEILFNIVENKPIENYQLYDSNSNLNNPFNSVTISSHFFPWFDNSCRLDSSFFLLYYIFYGECERKVLTKNTYAYAIYEIYHQIFNII